ncbi:plasma kallikrein-like [Leptopilina heterotoma]|uniref:plasma kallikrein-like n=1 Tax=Leptopilina heterotoma TaxID=63436 RepID=UPI001CA8DBC0|nr:plasma kallikrein-like [Leptopilina heterotoma]
MSLPKWTLTIFSLLVASNFYEVWGQNRIIGGNETDISKFPFLVEITLIGINFHPLCGAAIISKSWAVSASHCFMDIGDKLKIDMYQVVSGTTYTKEMITKDKKAPKIHNITKYHMHEKFGRDKSKEKSDGYDIAVFKVDPPFEYDELTQPAKLPKKNQAPKDKWAQIAGWGCTSIGGSTNPTLLSARIKRSSDKQCEELYPDIAHKNSVLCYGTPKDKNGTISNICQGDSGGPLIEGKDLVIGVVSMSKKSSAKYPGLFSSTSFYRDWIKGKTGV